jgi:hypothetical protein
VILLYLQLFIEKVRGYFWLLKVVGNFRYSPVLENSFFVFVEVVGRFFVIKKPFPFCGVHVKG